MREVDALITPGLQNPVRETHLELVFALWNRSPMAHHKSKPKGRRERLNVLAWRSISFDPAEERYWLGGRLVGVDDLVDAAACLLAAERMALHKARVYPRKHTQKDRRHLRMEIVA